MSQNYFTELAKIDVGKHIEKKGRFSYLSWTYAIDTLKKHHPDAVWEVKRDANGQPFFNTECGYFVEVAVTVDGITHSQIHPVLDNNNRPVAQPNSFQINTSIQRCLVKAIALHGLGLYIYAGEDLPGPDDDTPEEAPAKAPNNREKALAEAKEKAKSNADKKAVEDKESPTKEEVVEEADGGDVVEPINDAQKRAISNMLKLVSRKNSGFSEEEFLGKVISDFGKDSLDSLTFEEAKEVVTLINAEMRK